MSSSSKLVSNTSRTPLSKPVRASIAMSALPFDRRVLRW
jgi:hypothetical protein